LENLENAEKLKTESDELVRTIKGGIELTEDEWVVKLRKMKEETEKEIRDSHYAEQHLREKYKDEPTKIIALLRAKLKKVEEIFKESAQQELDQPKMESGTWGVCLSVPIIHLGTHVGLKICFFLHLTDKGYGLRVSKDMYDGMYDKPFETSGYIHPPATAGAIQKEVTDFLEARNNTIKRMEEKEKRFRKE
jgi:hypothetical protein